MKKFLTLIGAFTLCAAVSSAQSDKHSITATDIGLVHADGNVSVVFTLNAGAKSTKSSHNLVITPAIVNGAREMLLPPVVVRGRRAEVTSLRHGLADGGRIDRPEPLFMKPGGSMLYKATVRYESWMRDGQLVLNGVSVGCCSSTETNIGLIAENILRAEPVTEIEIVEVPVATVKATTGDQLANRLPFVAPVEEFEKARKTPEGTFDYNMPLNLGKGLTAPKQMEVERFISETREGAISIYFRQGRNDIDRNYMKNNKHLVELISAVRALSKSEDTDVVRIVIAGFASPEGAIAVNERLAWNRAVAVKTFLTANSDIDPSLIQIYNGSVDWIGLREMVAKSDMTHKYRIIDIIDTTPIWDQYHNSGRLGELMRVGGGEPYRYMSRNFFPELRQAAYIRIYYENK